ncbi:peroxiredoxin (alkyl hydroperoxide reductase subunit C) [Nakamurella sp. UYEF19]|uniref:peroxiredoxin n=1 Tax=Nakamurella sp. UYEF19 TaxID=1756392 RepID=UPI003393CE8E
MSVEIGSVAPDFTLPDANRAPVSLSSFRGKKAVLVVFYPFAFSGTCTTELCAVRDDLASFQNEHVQVLAVSTDPAPALQAWAAAQGYEFPLLSDFWPHGVVSQAYGSFHEGGFALRGTFLIDTEGVVRFAEVNGPGEARDQGSWKRAVAALATA